MKDIKLATSAGHDRTTIRVGEATFGRNFVGIAGPAGWISLYEGAAKVPVVLGLAERADERSALSRLTRGDPVYAKMADEIAGFLTRHRALQRERDALLGAKMQAMGNVLLSSRLSLEMVSKAVRARLEVIAAVGAPTSLAIDVARRFGLTLCGFVRKERATMYTHPHRISNVAYTRAAGAP